MIKLLMMLILVTVQMSCQIKEEEKRSQSKNILYEENLESFNSEIVPELAFLFGINIQFINTTKIEQEKFNEAMEIIKKVIASEDFMERVLNHTYNGVKMYVDNGGYSNSQIYRKILEGAESLNRVKNNMMDMEVELYYASNNTVGYTLSNSPRIWVNTKYFYTNPVTGVASNLMHEWLHKLGFRHSNVYSPDRDYSVPYAIGRMVGSIGRKFVD